ncbi:MAG: hypothetical protein Ct9H300mP23_01380 [Nitrospinota bacterium]|nr:MAG: hypothetical protein Ct9H300mP23_01380 [Nitrospinota bacterium]
MLEPVMDVGKWSPLKGFYGGCDRSAQFQARKIKDLADRAGAKVIRAEVPLSGKVWVFHRSTIIDSGTG